MKINITKGNPTPSDWTKIGEMLNEGYKQGIDIPNGICWEVEK